MGSWSIIGIMGHFTTIFALKLMKLFSHLLRQNAINIQNRLLWHLNWWRHRAHKKIANCTRRKDISIFRKELEIESNTLSAFWIALITFTFFLFLFWFFFCLNTYNNTTPKAAWFVFALFCLSWCVSNCVPQKELFKWCRCYRQFIDRAIKDRGWITCFSNNHLINLSVLVVCNLRYAVFLVFCLCIFEFEQHQVVRTYMLPIVRESKFLFLQSVYKLDP